MDAWGGVGGGNWDLNLVAVRLWILLLPDSNDIIDVGFDVWQFSETGKFRKKS